MSDGVASMDIVLKAIADNQQLDFYVRFQERNEKTDGVEAVNAELTITRTTWEELGSPSSVIITVSDAVKTETADETTEAENLEEADAKGK